MVRANKRGRRGSAAALATISILEQGHVHDHIYRFGDRLRTGLSDIGHSAGVPTTVCGYGSLFALCSMEGPVESHYDILRNAELFEAFRTKMITRGGIELPDARTTRSHISNSYTVDDIDCTVEAAQDALRAPLDCRALSQSQSWTKKGTPK